jgi:hypothetical protein
MSSPTIEPRQCSKTGGSDWRCPNMVTGKFSICLQCRKVQQGCYRRYWAKRRGAEATA